MAISAMAALVCFCAVFLCNINNYRQKQKNIFSEQPRFFSENIYPQPPFYINKIGPLSRAERKMIADIIAKTVQDGLDGKKITYPDLKTYPKKWRAMKVVYITFYIGDRLRGSRGNFRQEKPLLYAIIDSAYDAAFKDSEFSKLTQKEFNSPDFNFQISVLGEKHTLKFKNERDIVEQLKPLKHSVFLKYTEKSGKTHQSLFLPQMWKKYPNARKFWQKLKHKANIRKNFFSNKFIVELYDTETIKDFDHIVNQDSSRIEKAVSAYKKLFQPDGRITYEWNFKTGKISKKNNIVREMGSGYGLAYAYYMLHDETMRPILKDFLQYAQSVTIPHNKGRLIADRQNSEKIRIPAGASALALLAVLYYEQEAGDSSFAQFRIDLKNALLSLYESGVGVHSSPYDASTSPYYDGETWLALTMYNIFYPDDEEVSQILSDMNQTMYNKYHNKYLPNFFHWGTQTAAHQIAHNQDELMSLFLQKQLNLYINYVDFSLGSSSCAYAEGLGEAALALKGKNELMYKKTLERLEKQMEVARILQDIPLKKHKQEKISPELRHLLGLFLNNSKSLKTRNDVTQHCLSAMLKAQQVFNKAQ